MYRTFLDSENTDKLSNVIFFPNLTGKPDNYSQRSLSNVPHGCSTGMGENDGEDKAGN